MKNTGTQFLANKSPYLRDSETVQDRTKVTIND